MANHLEAEAFDAAVATIQETVDILLDRLTGRLLSQPEPGSAQWLETVSDGGAATASELFITTRTRLARRANVAGAVGLVPTAPSGRFNRNEHQLSFF